MAVELVERHTQLAELEAALRRALAGTGGVVLVSGEAGAGKTTLVRRFTSEEAARSKALWGMCDELLTPRPLGPFRDMAAQLRGDIAELPVPAVLEILVAALGAGAYPTVVVVEDAHWADEATVDAIRFLGRRVGRMPALLIVTFREDEVPADHPLRLAVGAIPPEDVRRVSLPPLSRDGVAQLAGHEDIEELYRRTGGNPFYVTEVLAAPDAAVPPTVQDAVMARVRSLSDLGRACVEVAAVIPSRTERGVCEFCGVIDGIDEATILGVLRTEGTVIHFTHELARQAVEHSLSPSRRRDINQQVLDALDNRDTDPAVLTHHAVQAENAEAVARYAPIAARRAASFDSHREAVAHFEQALDRPEHHDPGELAALWYEYAHECYLIERHGRAEHALHRAIEMHTELGDHAWLGADLALLSDVLWFLGRSTEAEQSSATAIEVLEQLPANPTLAKVYAQHAKLVMSAWRPEEAAVWGDKAITLARQQGYTEMVAHALNTVGVARWVLPSADNRLLVESLDLARANGLTTQAARAYLNLVEGYRHFMDYPQAARYLDEGLAFCDEHDLIAMFNRLLEFSSACHFEQGMWAEAEQDARRAAASGEATRVLAQTILGLVETRRGDRTCGKTLAHAQQLADETGYAWDLVPVGLARVELAWLQGDVESAVPIASAMLDLAHDYRSARWIGEAALWLHRAGALDSTPLEALEPYALQIEEQWQEAAAAWARLGRPYEQADALAEAPEPESLLGALALLDRLGARPRAAMVRRRLFEMGVASVPRGPRESTRASPVGLTARQTDVLHLLAEGMTYRQIARRLHLSVKTVDRHLAAVRTKLDATTGDEAVAAARRLRILDTEDT